MALVARARFCAPLRRASHRANRALARERWLCFKTDDSDRCVLHPAAGIIASSGAPALATAYSSVLSPLEEPLPAERRAFAGRRWGRERLKQKVNCAGRIRRGRAIDARSGSGTRAGGSSCSTSLRDARNQSFPAPPRNCWAPRLAARTGLEVTVVPGRTPSRERERKENWPECSAWPDASHPLDAARIANCSKPSPATPRWLWKMRACLRPHRTGQPPLAGNFRCHHRFHRGPRRNRQSAAREPLAGGHDRRCPERTDRRQHARAAGAHQRTHASYSCPFCRSMGEDSDEFVHPVPSTALIWFPPRGFTGPRRRPANHSRPERHHRPARGRAPLSRACSTTFRKDFFSAHRKGDSSR
jgi:hypothetical protein